MFSLSSSSSECDCGVCYRYGATSDNNSNNTSWRNPFHPTMGNPLIYYAQVPPVNRPQRRQSKRNPNCFIKAFRWYTQEHVPQRNNLSSENQDMSGFANWLDTKYYQFLRDSQMDQITYQLKLKQTSTLEANKIPPNKICAPCSTTKYSRIKSPWSKRRRLNKNGGDAFKKSNQSLHYILPPKDLTRPASECCQPIIPSTCNRSHASVASSGIQSSKRTIRTSHSFTCTCQEKEALINTSTMHKGSTNYDKWRRSNKPIAIPKVSADRRALNNISPTRDVSCQCFERITPKANAQTQYETSRISSGVKSQKCKGLSLERPGSIPPCLQACNKSLSKPETRRSVERASNTKLMRESVYKTNTWCQCSGVNIKVDAQSQYQDEVGTWTPKNSAPKVDMCSCPSKIITTSINPKDRESIVVKNLTTLTKTSPSFTTLVNGAVQTSDHSITLEENTNQYPLFLKIICADRLCEECKQG